MNACKKQIIVSSVLSPPRDPLSVNNIKNSAEINGFATKNSKYFTFHGDLISIRLNVIYYAPKFFYLSSLRNIAQLPYFESF